MSTIDKTNIQTLCALLHQAGVREAVVSPGSRNAGINLALAMSGCFRIHTVVDERVAAFVALGMASAGTPVVTVCTSGTALLNYGPAVAEAYYRRAPLIVVSADRPAAAIDQRDSQTIRQYGTLASIVRLSVDVPDTAEPRLCWRLINEALDAATGNIPGPVHINMPLDRPLTPMTMTEPAACPRLRTLRASMPDMDQLSGLLRGLNQRRKVMVACGSSRPLTIPEEVFRRGNVVLGAEITSNIKAPGLNVHPRIATDSAARHDAELFPDTIINIGGALVLDSFKAFLRRSGAEVINVGYDDTVVDTFYHLTTRVEVEPQVFFDLWGAVAREAQAISAPEPTYRELWSKTREPRIPRWWSDARAMELLAEHSRGIGSLFLANGMTVRYAQLCHWDVDQVLANRGVSGIDGCTSTAAGIAMTSDRTVLLVTGDMGMAYDIGALALKGLGANFKIAVLDNGGGDIFRHVATTAPFIATEHSDMITAQPVLPLQELAAAYGFSYFRAGSEAEARETTAAFMAESRRPAILHLITPDEGNRKAYDSLFNS